MDSCYRLKYQISTSREDQVFVAKFTDDLSLLLGCTIEMFEKSPQSLLSPVMRDLLLDRAKLVKSQWDAMKLHSIVVDNPGDPMNPVSGTK